MRPFNIFPFLLAAYFSSSVIYANDTLTIKLKLRNVTNVLTFNQGHVPDHFEEYRWEVLIDSDNNMYTGNPEGYDVGLVIKNTKLPGSISYTGTIISGSDLHTLIYQGSTASYGNELTVYFGNNDSCLHIKALKSFPEIAGVTAGSRMMARTHCYTESGLKTDETQSCTIPGTIADITGDISQDYADILSVSAEEVLAGLSDPGIPAFNLNFFPNPNSGILYLSEKSSWCIFSADGKKLICDYSDRIELFTLPSGNYFIRDEKTKLTRKIIVTIN